MNQEQFIAQHESSWRKLEARVFKNKKKNKKKQKKNTSEQVSIEEFAKLYRMTCQHLALARSRLYQAHLIERLNTLVVDSHTLLYGSQHNALQKIVRYLFAGFPQKVRKEWRVVLLSSSLFYLPFLSMFLLVLINPDMVYTVLDGNQLSDIEYMYDPANRDTLGRSQDREADSDLMMFGYYVAHNTGIGFRTFASGLLFGIGTIFTLLFNGLYLGTVSGHLTQIGFIETFWSFVAGHSALELNAIMLSGAAGLKLGSALMQPGQRTRLRALQDHAKIAIQIMYGAAGMFFLAAMVEGFWSPSTLATPQVKYYVGITMWILLISYFVFGGRRGSR